MIYLDNAATTFPKPENVYRAMDKMNREGAVNAGRGSYKLAQEASKIIADTKSKIRQLVHLDTSAVVFAPSITIAINQIVNGLDLRKNAVIYVSPYEHNAVARSIYALSKKMKFTVKELPVNDIFEIDIEKMKYEFSKDKPEAVFCTHVSNVTGYVLPIEEIFGESKKQGSINILDSAQSMGLIDIRADLIKVDIIAFEFKHVRFSCCTCSKEENLHRYEKNAFDAIVIDEAHHSAANSYKKVLDYFEPKLWLGMTATPDKRDDNLEGRNIYEIFNHQIAYEIRLQDAMEEDLLCPFHYFGITDLDIIADAGKSSGEKVENFRYLISEERVENVMKQAEYFGYSGDRVKGLIFCSRIDEAKELSKKFNDKGWRTLVLSGSDSEEARAAAIERLAGEESEDALDYIISVDIFSEGVDVPEINQVIMLRPTESPIVFIQQLGRGLRKAENKEYVVVLDFIGNYRNNFMIPIALSGDRSYNKDNIRRYVTEGGRVIPGASTIHFDEISRKRIFQAIDNANFSDIKLIRENYTNLKNKLGHIPALADFDKYGEMDVLRIFDNNSLGSYYKFLVKYEKEYTIRLSEDEEKAIEFISKKLACGKRIHELELLKRTL